MFRILSCCLQAGLSHAKIGLKLPAKCLQPARYVAGIANNGKGQDTLTAEATQHHGSELYANPGINRRETLLRAFGVPVF